MLPSGTGTAVDGPAEDTIDPNAPITGFTREVNELHHAFHFRFAGHVRLTRDLAALERLVADLELVRARIGAEAFQSEGRWQALMDMVDRRLDEYRAERGAVAQLQAASTPSDRRASVLTSQARIVLHRFTRHYAGQPRKSRDLARMREMVADLAQLFEGLRPLAEHIHLRTVAEEIGAVGGLLDLLRAEEREISGARRAGSLLDKSRNWQDLLAKVQTDWQREVLSQARPLRRPGLVQRYVDELDGILEGLMTVRHANLPDEHELATARAATLLARWHDELAAVRTERDALTAADLARLLWTAAQEAWQRFVERWSGEPFSAPEIAWLRDLADAVEELERQLASLACPGFEGVPDARLASLRDGLVTIERTLDQTVSWHEAGGER